MNENVRIILGGEFKRQFKRLKKKFRSLVDDYDNLIQSLKQDPMQGISLGFGGVHKVRMAVASKGGGKSGGARVITYTITQNAPDEYQVTLLSIYDKGEIENLTDAYIQVLVNEIQCCLISI